MPKVVSWNQTEAKTQLMNRLRASRKYREQFEAQWKENYDIINNAQFKLGSAVSVGFDEVLDYESGDVDSGDSAIGMNYAFKYLRFQHSQLSANPPSVIARPTSSDPEDRQKADAADRMVRFGKKDQNLDERVDMSTLSTLTTGNGWFKEVWDKDKGDVHDFNEETSEITMKGDIHSYVPSVENMWLDPDAKSWDEVRYVFERVFLPLDEAVFIFPDAKEQLKNVVLSVNNSVLDSTNEERYTDRVAIFEYYEKGLPINGMAGRHAWFLEDGTLLKPMTKNPHVHAKLPYHLFTYLDVPDQVYGKSAVEYVTRLQDMLNRLDSQMLDVIQAHSTIRLAVPDGTDIEDEAISNSAWDWVKFTGPVPPHFIPPGALPNDPWRFRDQLLTAIQELFGINDSMLGIQRREQSAVSQQTSIEAGTMVHRRLFKKYQMFVEGIYKDYLELIKENWDEPRMILVLGKEKAFESVSLKGADIEGGFDLVVEYGASLPIDPNMRREAITLLMEPLKEAGMSMKQILKLMKLNDLEGMYDRMEMAADRQREIFEEMTAMFHAGTPVLIRPREKQEHQGMLDYAYDYIMSAEFKYLPEALKKLLEQHITLREGMAAQAQAGAAAAQPVQVPGMPAPVNTAPAQPQLAAM